MAGPVASPVERRDLAERAALLVGATLAWNAVEAVVAVAAGVRAGSVALVGFGLDSVIEALAAGALLWRLRAERLGRPHEHLEARARRLVGVTFLLLALYVVLQSGWTLWTRQPPEESLLGIVLAAISLVVMPLLALAKLRVADRLGSAALRAEAMETIACSYLSLTLLVGLGARAWVGWWWADPVAALLMVPWLIHEGREALEEDD